MQKHRGARKTSRGTRGYCKGPENRIVVKKSVKKIRVAKPLWKSNPGPLLPQIGL